MAFREAVKAGYYDLQSARDTYRFAVGPHGMHADVALRYIEVRERYRV
jgi:leucyl-tRNA synthetase